LKKVIYLENTVTHFAMMSFNTPRWLSAFHIKKIVTLY